MLDPSEVFDRAADLQRKGDLAGAERLYLDLLRTEPSHVGALQMLAFLRYEQGRFGEALASVGTALTANPNSPTLLLNYAVMLDALQRREEAVATYDRALALKADYAEAWFNRGIALRQLKRPNEALASFDRMLAIVPEDADACNERGNALRDLGRPLEALASYDRALAVRPNDPGILNNQGNALRDLDRMEEALSSYDRALAIAPNFVGALNNRGSALRSLKRPAEALASFDRASVLNPNDPGALYNRGNALQDMKRPAEALASLDKALALRPDDPEALYSRGNALRDLERPTEALASFDKALALRPDNADALNNRGNILQTLKRPAEALASFDRALALRPDADTFYNRGNALSGLNDAAAALASYESALQIEPDHRYALSGLAQATLAVCHWDRAGLLAAQLEACVRQRSAIISPFTLLGYSDDPELHSECAKTCVNEWVVTTEPLWRGEIWPHDKLRIAYLSSDFRRHPVSYLMAELLERHDRTRFEVLGISHGVDDRSETRARLMNAFDQFHDVCGKSDVEVARIINDLRVHIVIDLNGHTEGRRLNILASRPAPIQVSYLGYASTTGADFVDYLMADKVALPLEQQPYYTEKIIHLPDSFLPTDTKKTTLPETPTRQEAGLPEGAFVFCAFHNSYKITPHVFDIWMRLLVAVPSSVLWLSHANAVAMGNLRRAATARGVDSARLLFAAKLERPEDHLARHRLADLFLDTQPYNAHTTASDALWTGVPVLTCTGMSFAGRVATSLLNAVGLPELATSNLAEYEALALRLATDTTLLQGFRQRLARNRLTCPLFDTDRLRRHIESAYTTMWEIAQRGEEPRGFSVEATG